jgi:hypothetical protein
VETALQTQLLSWEDDIEDHILLAGIPIFLVSAPATRTVVAQSKGQEFRQELLDFALPHDWQFVKAIRDIIAENDVVVSP